MSLNTIELCYGVDTSKKINSAHILVVGVGGIGCELLKVLTNSGYRKLTIIDLDTIEMTNLNRQFYFRSYHKGLSKARVGKQSVMLKDPTLDIEDLHASIFEQRFDVAFYQSFKIVFCALDNIPARQHLAKMCTLSGIPLVDAGTEGFVGNVSAVVKGVSQCENCYPFPPPQTFPTCTIRASPTEPIHAITYAMSLYDLLFGVPDKNNHLYGMIDFEKIKNSEGEQGAIILFNTLFDELIKIQQESEQNKIVFPLDYQKAQTLDQIHRSDVEITQQKNLPEVQRLHPLKYYAQAFVKSYLKVSKSELCGKLKFEKDDPDCIKFVTSVTNMRIYNFTQKYKQISLIKEDKFKYLTEHEVKILGGKVVPAIASTNAIVAGVQYLEASKLIEDKPDSLRTIFVQKSKHDNGRHPIDLLRPTYPLPGSDKCLYCSNSVFILDLKTDPQQTKFSDFISFLRFLNIENTNAQVHNPMSEASKKIFEDLVPFYMPNTDGCQEIINQCGDMLLHEFFGCMDLTKEVYIMSAENEIPQRFETWKNDVRFYIIIKWEKNTKMSFARDINNKIQASRKDLTIKKRIQTQSRRKRFVQDYKLY